MQTSIDRFYRRSQKRRRVDSYSNSAEVLRKMAWLSWPLIYWSGPIQSVAPAARASMRTIYGMIVAKLWATPSGLFALQPMDAHSETIRLIEITGERLGAVTHALVLAERAMGSTREFVAARRQLHLLSKCLRDSEGFASTKGRQRNLRSMAWTVDGQGARPPLVIGGMLDGHRSLASLGAGQAIMEYELRSGASDVSRFLGALQSLVDEFPLVDEEAGRRRGVFSSLLQAAVVTQPAYLPMPFSSPRRGTISKWKLNPAFLDTVVELFLREHLPRPVVRDLTRENGTPFSFEQVSARLIGVELSAFAKGPLSESLQPPDVVKRVLGALADLAPESSVEMCTEFANLAARCAVLAGRADAPRQVACWLRTCRQLGQAAVNGTAIWNVALNDLQNWIAASCEQPQHVRRLLELLETRSVELFSYGRVRHQTPPEELWRVARLGELALEEAQAVIDLDLLATAAGDFPDRPQQLAAFVMLVSTHRQRWNNLQSWQQQYWIRLFSERHDLALLRRLMGWMESLLREKKFTFHDVTCFIENLVDFLRRDTRQECILRESFLGEHFWVLDRVLMETENSLRLSPVEGFESWRSHERLWNLIFGSVEILYEWEAVRFSKGATMLEGLFRWCRDRFLAAIGQENSYPPAPLHSMAGSEFLSVRLSGGDAGQLLVFFGDFFERWGLPDDPANGWRFLDRQPEVQNALQEHCLCPKRINDVFRLLRHLALAVRLKRDADLGVRLEAWKAAAALQDDPLARLCAFSRLAGNGDSLPAAVERIILREQTLRRERDALAARNLEGQATPSSDARLAKLDRWLLRPTAIAAWAARDLRRMTMKLLPALELKALQVMAEEAVRTHWESTFDPASSIAPSDWENARRLYYSTVKNKALLRKLLRRTTERDRQWRLRHPPNAKFLAELQANGLDAAAWLAPFCLADEVRGKTWTVQLEQDPLRVLQMGNWFGTCLSVENSNAFAAITNAVEINKQVLYLKDERGVVIGRKLIALTAHGRLFGFRSYGAGEFDNLLSTERPLIWVKIRFDLACLEIARRANGHLLQFSDTGFTPEQLELAAEWYDDGAEEFDWWVARRDLAAAVCHGDRETVAVAVLEHIHQLGLDLQDDTHRVPATMRALLWLGDTAVMVVQSLGTKFFPPKCARFLCCHTPSAAVRTLFQSDAPETLS